MERYMFNDQNLMGSHQINEKHEVILEKLWQFEFQPSFSWRTIEILFPVCTDMTEASAANLTMKILKDRYEFAWQMKINVYKEVYKGLYWQYIQRRFRNLFDRC